jgi:undecaprenyl-diphosphatase
MNIDFYLFQYINSFAGKWVWLDALGVFLAQYFGYILALSLFLFLLKNRQKYLLMLVYGFSAAIFARFGITEFIRWLLPKSRPYVENNVNLLLEHIDQCAFPSGHAAFFFALSAVVYFYNKKIGYLFFTASFLVCLARVFCGIHWPLDILAGALVGIFSGWLILKIFKK